MLLLPLQPETFAAGQEDTALWRLGTICDKLDCIEMLDTVDKALARRMGPDCPAAATIKSQPSMVSPANAVAMFTAAGAAHLPHFEAACGSFIGRNIRQVAAAGPQGGLAALVQRAAEKEAAATEAAQKVASEHRSMLARVRQLAQSATNWSHNLKYAGSGPPWDLIKERLPVLEDKLRSVK